MTARRTYRDDDTMAIAGTTPARELLHAGGAALLARAARQRSRTLSELDTRPDSCKRTARTNRALTTRAEDAQTSPRERDIRRAQVASQTNLSCAASARARTNIAPPPADMRVNSASPARAQTPQSERNRTTGPGEQNAISHVRARLPFRREPSHLADLAHLADPLTGCPRRPGVIAKQERPSNGHAWRTARGPANGSLAIADREAFLAPRAH